MRIFLAFTLSESSLIDVLKNQEYIKSLNVNLVRKENIHLTLFFFGDIKEEIVENIINIIKKIKFQKFQLLGTNLIYLPNYKKVSVLALEFKLNEILNNLINQYDKEISKLGFKRDKKFLPHITIARVNKKIPVIKYENNMKIDINNIKLFKSELTLKGAIYSELFSYE